MNTTTETQSTGTMRSTTSNKNDQRIEEFEDNPLGLLAINFTQRLYCLKCGDGMSCLGFDVCERKIRGMELELPVKRLAEHPALGTWQHYQRYHELVDEAHRQFNETGRRLGFELSPKLVGLEGCRVEVDTIHGETRRFWVGKSSGWIPCHIELKIRTSRCGFPADHEYKRVLVLQRSRGRA